ncbi:hypothetical protein DKX38_010649 [Salix brachista]|uniref:Gag1-like clamp domain-containing protein n=1 Tax=Salix brachista TaxID=2182728 RepID=A0A5N5ME66_9ROSI|nr:hypothetical protein DKX38_010649 [Salix brachista]
MYSKRSFLTQTGRSFGKKPFSSIVLFSGACFGALFLLGMESFKRKFKAVFSSRSCFGCCAKPPTISEADATSKGLRGQERLIKKSSISDDFWSTSAGEMENIAVHSQGRLSSISTLNQLLDPSYNAGSTSNPPEFVNRGKFKSLTDWNATYESLLGSNKPFSRPVPLAEMVDFLVDAWEQEGLYD